MEIGYDPLPEEFTKSANSNQFLLLKEFVTKEDNAKCLLDLMAHLGKENV